MKFDHQLLKIYSDAAIWTVWLFLASKPSAIPAKIALGLGTQRTPLFSTPEAMSVVIISHLEGSDDDVSTRVATSSFLVEIIARVPSGLKATLCGPKPVIRSMTLTSFWVSIIDTVSDLPDSLVKIPYLELAGFK